MKKGVIIAIIIGIIAIILLFLIKYFTGYASWTNQMSNNKLGKCLDTDNGKEFLTPGIVTWTFRERTYKYVDRCTLGIAGFITEYYCDGREKPVPISYNCARAEGTTKGTCNRGIGEGAYCE